MRHHYTTFQVMGAGQPSEYGALAGCDEAIFVPAVIPAGPAQASFEGTIDGVNWFVLTNLTAVALTEGVPLVLPNAGCFKTLRGWVDVPATIQWASRWSD